MSAEQVLAATSAATITTDPAGVVTAWNPAAEALFGWSEADALGRTVASLVLPEDWRPFGVVESVAAGQAYSGTYRGRHRDGTVVRVATTVVPVCRDGQVVAQVGHSRPLVDTEVDELLVRRLSAIVASSADSIVGLETDGTVTSWNPASEGMYGWTAAEVVGVSIFSLVPADQHEGLRLLMSRVALGEVVPQAQTTGWRKDGTSFAVDLRLSSILGEDGAVLGFSGIARDVTERVTLKLSAEADRERLAQAQALAHVGSCEIDLVTGVVRWSDEGWRILGLSPAEQITQDAVLALVHPDDADGLRVALAELRLGEVPPVREFRLVRPDGEVRWVRESFALDGHGPATTALGTMLDVTEIRTADAERRTAEARLRHGFERAAVGMLTTDLDGRVVTVNSACLDILGRDREAVVGARGAEFMHPEDEELRTPRPAMLDGDEASYVAEHRILRPDGSVVWVQKTSTLVRDDGGHHAFFTVQLQDITARRGVEEELARRAVHDPLTGLPNRELLVDRLEQALTRAELSDGAVSVVFVDVDEFKAVNDELGHAAGDALLVQLTQRMQSVVRPGDTLARFGGDEFVLVCEGIGRDEVDDLATRITLAVERPFVLVGREVDVTVSAGVACGGATSTADGLLHEADLAMYGAKQAGRARAVVLDDLLAATASARLDVQQALRHALDRDQLEVHYQPVLDTGTGTVVGLEALVRWQHPERGLLAPGEFLDLADEAGLLPAVGSWVLHRATGQLVRWRNQLREGGGLWVAVNVSGRELAQVSLISSVAAALEETGLPADTLRLEIAESVVLSNGVEDTLAALRALGVRVSIDDFGTGLSSLSTLEQLPVDTVKIARSFVSGLGGPTPVGRSVVTAVIGLAGAMGLDVIAQGVETQPQLDALRELGVGTAQGHLWSAALTPEELAQWWAERAELRA